MLCWDSDYYEGGKYSEDAFFDNHLCDAFLYAWRYLYNYQWEPAKNNLKPGSLEATLQKEEGHEDRFIENLNRKKSGGYDYGDWE
jgi:hypothetical protein